MDLEKGEWLSSRALNDGAHHYTSGGTRVALWSPALRHFKLTSTIRSQYVVLFSFVVIETANSFVR